jgi:hypothetical protein
MTETKYGKYFITYDKEKWRWPNKMYPGPVMARLDDAVAKGSNFYLIHWMLPPGSRHEKELVSSMTSTPKGAEQYSALMNHPMGGHPPHIHKDAELLFHIGTNPDDPMDLGAEAQIYLGPEMEKHIITKTCVIYIPPNFIHSPWKPVKTWRPWIFIEVNQGPIHTEKSYRQLLPRDLREAVDYAKMWPDEGY